MAFDRRIKFPHLSPKPIESPVPDFTTGLCTIGDGVKIAREAVTEESSVKAIRARRLARGMCSAPCPLLAECRAWVTEMEDPPGSWGGVWGGLDPWNRRGLELIIVGREVEVVPYLPVDK